MNNTEKQFLAILQQRAREQASVEQGSPLPEWLRPLAAFVGEHTPVALLTVSFILAVLVSVSSFGSIYHFYIRGILGWLIIR